MIDLDRKILFIHIPKCAGTFIEKNITPDIDWHAKGEKHYTLQRCVDHYGEDTVKQCFRFSVIRNPFSRLLSFYLYHQRKNTQLFTVNLFESNIRAFKKDYYDSFSKFIFNLEHYYHKLESWAKNDIKPCHDFLITHQGISVNTILKQESLTADLEKLKQDTGMLFSEERVNASPKAYNLDDHYTGNSIDFVLSFYKTDFYHYYPGSLDYMFSK